ncbi:MAG: restriction endonuclease subunit S, partial [Clostridia bacterium]
GAGKCCIVIDVQEPTVFESHLIRVRIDKSKANPYFVYYYFNSWVGRENMKTIVEQVAAAGIRGSDLVRLMIPFPDLPTQNRIVDVLMSIDEKIDLNRKINHHLAAMSATDSSPDMRRGKRVSRAA